MEITCVDSGGYSKGLCVSKGSHVTHPSASLDGDLLKIRHSAVLGCGYWVVAVSEGPSPNP